MLTLTTREEKATAIVCLSLPGLVGGPPEVDFEGGWVVLWTGVGGGLPGASASVCPALYPGPACHTPISHGTTLPASLPSFTRQAATFPGNASRNLSNSNTRSEQDRARARFPRRPPTSWQYQTKLAVC